MQATLSLALVEFPMFDRLSGLAAVTAAGLALFACTPVIPPDTAIMPRTAAGTPIMSDQGAIQTAAYVLGDPSRTAGQPGEAARALAAVDYLAGALYSNPHWVGIPAITKIQMVQGREEERAYLGIAPAVPSQLVVDGLMRAATALDAGDTAAAEAALPASTFTLGPQATVARLTHLPYLQAANVAAQHANYDITFDCGASQNCG